MNRQIVPTARRYPRGAASRRQHRMCGSTAALLTQHLPASASGPR
jgi:hypothetical protein